MLCSNRVPGDLAREAGRRSRCEGRRVLALLAALALASAATCQTTAPHLVLRDRIELTTRGNVLALAYTLDGRSLVTVDESTDVTIRDAETLEPECSTSLAPGVMSRLRRARGLAISEHGRHVDLLSGITLGGRTVSSIDRYSRVDSGLERGEDDPSFGWADGVVPRAPLRSDRPGRRLACLVETSGAESEPSSEAVVVLDRSLRELRRIDVDQLGPVSDLALSPDGRWLAIAGSSVWEYPVDRGREGQERLVESARLGGVSRLAYVAGDRLVVLAGDRLLAVDGSLEELACTHFGVSPDGRYLGVRTPDGDLVVRDVSQDVDVARHRVPEGDNTGVTVGPGVEVLGLAVRPGGRAVAVSYAGGVVRVFEGDRAQDLTDARPFVRSLGFSRDGRHLAIGARSFLLFVELSTGRQIWAPSAGQRAGAPSLCPGVTGPEVLVVDCLGAHVFDATRGRRVLTFATTAPAGPAYAEDCTAALSPDGDLLAIGDASGDGWLVDLQAGAAADLEWGFEDAAWSADGARLATVCGRAPTSFRLASIPSLLRFHDRTGAARKVTTLRDQAGLVRSVAFVPDGDAVLIAGLARVERHDLVDEGVDVLEPGDLDLGWVRFVTPELCAATAQRELFLLDYPSFEVLDRVGFDQHAFAPCLSPDGRHVAVLGAGSVCVYRIER